MESSQQLQAMPQEEASRSIFDSVREASITARRLFVGCTLAASGIGIGLGEASTGAGAATQVTAVTAGAKPITSAEKLPKGVTLNFPGSEKVYESTSESHSTVTASDVAKGKITILSYLNANGVPKKEITTTNCFWTPGGWNSGDTIHSPEHPTLGQVKFFKDDRPTLVCRDSASPTGWEKAGNHGPNGTVIDNCGNYFIPFGKPPEHITYITTPVILEKSFKDKMDISVKATALAIGRDQFHKICGEASATAKASEEVTVEGYLKSGEGKGNEAVKEYDSVTGELQVEAKAHVDCGDTIIVIEEQTPTTTTRPKPTTTTTIPKRVTTTTTRPPTTTTTTIPTRKAEVSVVKKTKNPDNEFIHTPSGTFRFKEVCQDGKRIVKHEVIYDDKDGRLVQPLGECNVGSIADVTELTPLHQNRQEWTSVTKPTQFKVVGPNGDIFYFTDREIQKKKHPVTTTTTTVPETTTTTSTTTTTIPEYAPYVSAPANVETVDEGATFVDCESAYSIPVSDGVEFLPPTIQEGSVTTPEYNSSVSEFCETITAPDYIPNPDSDTVTITAIDKVNHLTSSADFYFAVREQN